MKRFKYIYILSALVATVGLSGCIDETQPEDDTATGSQVGQSSSALEALLNGIPSQMSQGYLVYGTQYDETDMAYPQFMIAQTELLGDMYPEGEDYRFDWYLTYNTFSYNVGATSVNAFLPWFTLYKFIKSANDVIGAVNLETASDEQKGMAGCAYAARAFDYYMLTVFYEPVANIYTDCDSVLGLTVPIVTEQTSREEAQNNPRVSHDEMIAFILSDLDKAEACLANYTPSSRKVPTLPVVYGIKAKTYLWDKDYANAAKYARLAIDASGATPMSEDEWLSPTAAFNTATSAWLWYTNYVAEQMGNLCNFTGWMASENEWGYATNTSPSIDRSLYETISSTDFRKHAFLDPGRMTYYNYQTVRKEGTAWFDDQPDYLNLKFRCVDGNYITYSVGGACDVPIMRVEEMYYIEALAKGLGEGVSAGAALLNDFVQTYRDPNYIFKGSSTEDFERAVLDQMRVEFWGEGNAFPVAKMCALGVIQNYEGTNAPNDFYKINCQGIKPNWNFVVPTAEINSNSAIKNNPDPTTAISYPSPVGQYSDPK